MKEPVEIAVATGSTVTKESLLKEDEGQLYDITKYGAVSEGDPVKNTEAVNAAIEAASQAGGGTVVVPAGDFKTYTIRLLDNVNFRIDKDGIIRAARTDMYDQDGNLVEEGEGGNYDEPEVNLYAGLQDHGHTYFANSLFYAADKSNICIYGEGLVDGSYIDDDGYVQNTLSGGDPQNPEKRSENGDQGTWFGNKGFSLVRCENVVIDGISILNGGHFAIIAEGVVNMTVDGITVDTNRDAFDVDCCEDVTVRNSRFNSLTDDAIVMKASYGAGVFMPTHNVLIEDCVVSGYDAGSGVMEKNNKPSFLIEEGVLKKYNGPGGEVSVPPGVTAIGFKAFMECDSLTGITLPEGVTSVGEQAFMYCKNLRSINFPESLTDIDARAFMGCRALTGVVFPKSLWYIGAFAFAGCSELTEIRLPERMTVLQIKAFMGCESLECVTLPASSRSRSRCLKTAFI